MALCQSQMRRHLIMQYTFLYILCLVLFHLRKFPDVTESCRLGQLYVID